MRLPIKPMSVNEAWQGRRFKTPAYKKYERDVLLMLKRMTIPEGELIIKLDWGFSNYGACDFDNPIKPFVDCLQKKFLFNDNKIKRGVIEKHKVPKGEEFIEFMINSYSPSN